MGFQLYLALLIVLVILKYFYYVPCKKNPWIKELEEKGRETKLISALHKGKVPKVY